MRVLILGATGFVGSWVMKKLKEYKPEAEVFETSLSRGVDLRVRHQTDKLFAEIRPEYVINCAAYVGGIQYGYKFPTEIYYNNLQMILNIFEACRQFKVKRLVQPISNCAYPAKEKFFKEKRFWNGPLDDSVLAYGMVRKMAWVGAWAYNKQYGLDTISLILSNMYGPLDHFDEARSHAIGALIRKIIDAKRQGKKEVVVWGTGRPVREWLYVEDGAEAIVRSIDINPEIEIINIGTGKGVSIKKVASLIKKSAGWNGVFKFDKTKPDGAPCKRVDGSRGCRILHFKPRTPLEAGIAKTVAFYGDTCKI